MNKNNSEHMEIADRLEQYCDYGNPPGLNDLLFQAANLLRKSKLIIDIDNDDEDNNDNESRNKYELH